MAKPVPEIIWSPLVAAALMALAGLTGYAAGMPWLFPSLGPTAYLQSTAPNQRESRLYNAVAGHYASAAAALFAVWITGSFSAPPMNTTVTGARVAAAVIGIALGIFLDALIRAQHAPAAATNLIITLGFFRTSRDFLAFAVGVLIVSFAGEAFRRVRLKRLESL
jgi:HPP family